MLSSSLLRTLFSFLVRFSSSIFLSLLVSVLANKRVSSSLFRLSLRVSCRRSLALTNSRYIWSPLLSRLNTRLSKEDGDYSREWLFWFSSWRGDHIASSSSVVVLNFSRYLVIISLCLIMRIERGFSRINMASFKHLMNYLETDAHSITFVPFSVWKGTRRHLSSIYVYHLKYHDLFIWCMIITLTIPHSNMFIKS